MNQSPAPKIRSYLYQKGQSGNPSGRPKGILNSTQKQFQKLKELAAGDAIEIYEQLKLKIAEGHSWAFQIYFKDLYTVPKIYDSPSIRLREWNTKDGNNKTVALERFLEALQSFEEYTMVDVLKIINTLSAVQPDGAQTITRTLDSTDELMKKVYAIQAVLAEKENDVEK